MSVVNLDTATRLDIICRRGDYFELQIDFGSSMADFSGQWDLQVRASEDLDEPAVGVELSMSSENYFDNDKTAPVRSLKSQWRIHLHLDAAAIKAYDPGPLLSQMMSDLQGGHTFRGQIHTILSELYKNASDYGLLKMDSSLRKQDDGILKYNQLKKDRLEALGEGSIHIEMGNQISSETSGKLFIVIEDSGEGFDYNKLQDDIFADKHRGLGLVNQVADKVQFEAPGNKVRIECHWNQ